MKTEYTIGFHGKTANEGPIVVGIAVGLTATEITEAMVADPQQRDDEGNSRAKRPIWPLCTLGYTATEDDMDLKLMQSISPRWSIPEGDSLVWFAYAQGALSINTVVEIFAKHYGVWLRD